MNYIPQKVRELFIEFFEKFSTLDSSQYKEKILKLASDEDEIKDLEDLFQSTSDYYEERKKLKESDKTSSEYFFDIYMEEWKKQNLNATKEDEKIAIEDFNVMLSSSILESADKLIADGVMRKKIEVLERKNKEKSDEEKEKIVDDFFMENNLYGLNQDDNSLEPQQTSDND